MTGRYQGPEAPAEVGAAITARIARRFARTAFGPRAAIGPGPDPDHADFDRLIGYAVIDT